MKIQEKAKELLAWKEKNLNFSSKLAKKDLLKLKFNDDNSYWIEKNGPKSKMKNQF